MAFALSLSGPGMADQVPLSLPKTRTCWIRWVCSAVPPKSLTCWVDCFGLLVSLPVACTLDPDLGTGLLDAPIGHATSKASCNAIQFRSGRSLTLFLLRWRRSAKAPASCHPHWHRKTGQERPSEDSLKREGAVLGGGLAAPESGKYAPALAIIRRHLDTSELTPPPRCNRPSQQSVP